MRAYRGVVKDGVVLLEEGVRLPDGAVVSVTVSEGELVKATLRNAIAPKSKRPKLKLKPMPTPG